jgi:EAL domain-containing protein (putative c-di-GMP-specific phosphodiesterase class I)
VMGIRTVAEYVEDPETLAAVRALGIDYAQGYAVGQLRQLS